MTDNEYFIYNELLKIWFNDEEDTPRNSTLFKGSGDFCSFAERLYKGFLYGDDAIYFQEYRALPCVKFLQDLNILEEGSMEYLHRRGKVRQYQNFREIVNSPEVLSAIEDLTKTDLSLEEMMILSEFGLK